MEFLPETPRLIAFLTASLLLGLAPGPDMLLVVNHALRHGFRSGMVALGGIASGAAVHLLAASLGLSLLLKEIPSAYALLRIGGGLYLLYLAIRIWRSDGVLFDDQDAAPQPSMGQIYRDGLLTNLLNPKVALFLIAFLPPFIPPEAPHPAIRALLLGLMFFLIGFAIMTLFALLAGRIRPWLGARPGVLRAQAKAAALVMAAFAFALWLDV